MEQSPHRTRPPHLGARRVVPASREGRRAPARRLRHRLRRSRPALRRAARAHRGAPAPRAALPPAPGRGPAAPGPPGLGRRSALQPALPPAPRRPARPRQRGAAEEPRRPAVRPAPGPHEAAVGDLARRRPAGRPLRARRQEPPRARRRDRGRRHHDRAVRSRARRREGEREPPPARRWAPQPLPSAAQLLGDALFERATQPGRARPHGARRRAHAAPACCRPAATGCRRWARSPSPACARRRRRR